MIMKRVVLKTILALSILPASLTSGTYNFNCTGNHDRCLDQCESSNACKPGAIGWSASCKRCRDRCDEIFERCQHRAQVCAPQFQKCIKEAAGDEMLRGVSGRVSKM